MGYKRVKCPGCGKQQVIGNNTKCRRCRTMLLKLSLEEVEK